MDTDTTLQIKSKLDEALLRIRAIADPNIEPREASELVGSALFQVYRARASASAGGSVSDALVVVSLEVDRALALVEAESDDPATVDVRELLNEVKRLAKSPSLNMSPARLPDPSKAVVTYATVGEPAVHELGRDVLFPTLPIGHRFPPIQFDPVASPEPPAAENFEELDALLDAPPRDLTPEVPIRAEQPAPREPVSPTSSEVLAEHAEVMVEELGVLGLLREPIEDQTWTGKERVERRLLARIDAILSCGVQVLPSLVRKLETRPLPDPELTWALIFLFGSLAGDDSVDEALRLARASALDDETMRRAVVDAFAHAPSSAVEGAIRPWLSSPNVNEVAVAVGALGRRGALMAPELNAAVESDQETIIAAAANVIGGVRGQIDDLTFDRLLHHADSSVVGNTIRGTLRLGVAVGARRARALVTSHQGAFGHAARWYALVEGRDGFEPLLENAAVSESGAGISALGWFGHLGAVPYLMGRLEADDEAIRTAVAGALHRILGAPSASAFPAAAPILPTTWVTDPDAWRGFWGRHVESATQEARYRFGAPWRSATNLLEIKHARTPRAARDAAYLELRARLPIDTPFDSGSFVARQQIDIRVLEDAIEQLSLGARRWPVRIHM